MNNRILLVGLLILQFAQLNAMDKPSIYDPLGALSPEERSRIIAEGRNIITNRKVNGQDLLIQIDFLSEDEFDEGGLTGRDESGLTRFSQGTYTKWSIEYFSQPAILMLFIDQGNGNYILDALNFTDMLMDEGIPDLVRRYIRDEVMRKENKYAEIISSGLYAIGEALNPIYREKLEQKGNEMLNKDKRYHRAHCVYGDCEYIEFTPDEKSVLGPTEPKDSITFHNLPESRSDNLNKVINKIVSWDYTHENEILSSWPWIYDNSNKDYILNFNIPEGYFGVKKDNPWSILNSSLESKSIAEKLPVMGWMQIHGWPATYCNFFAQDLSTYVLGHLPWGTGKVANKIHNYIISNGDFYKLSISQPEEIRTFQKSGYLIYYTLNDSPNPGHIAIAWITNNDIIQAGRNTGIMTVEKGFGSQAEVQIHVYLGHLKRRL